ncbi:MAG TPA: hypothetical protein VK837_09275 [Longimicrobiales bacterium]|nr:hypothetical protein [Longimicrobiales bacterium]
MSWTHYLPDPRHADRSGAAGGSAADRESIVLAFVCLAYVATTQGFGDPSRAVAWLGLGAVLLAFVGARATWPGWGLVTLGLAFGIAGRPFAVANHHFVLTWASLAMVLSLSAPDGERVGLVRHNVRWLLVAIMGFATLHKFISGPFMDGSFLAFGISAGAFAEPLVGYCARCAAAIAQNEAALGAFRATVPEAGASITLVDPIGNLSLVARAFGASIIFVEAAMFAGFLLAPRSRWTHLLVLAFAVVLGVIRQELTFISVVAALGYLSCPSGHLWLRRAYLVAAVVFSGLSVY